MVGESKKRYEVLVFNKIVRDLVEREEHHRYFKDEWADIHHELVGAPNVASARRRAEARFPAKDGFVIVDIVETKENDDAE